jgi:choline dehydrogenase-like flavoprotein
MMLQLAGKGSGSPRTASRLADHAVTVCLLEQTEFLNWTTQ